MTRETTAVAIEEFSIEEFGERFGALRIARPRAEAAMEKSLRTYGQLSPVVCARVGSARECEVVDGFKRLRASRRLKKPSLRTRMLDLTVRACKAAMIELNRRPSSQLESGQPAAEVVRLLGDAVLALARARRLPQKKPSRPRSTTVRAQ